MEKRLKQYLAYLQSVDSQHLDWEAKQTLRAEILEQIHFFQHERLVHLIVTGIFAILLMLAVIGSYLYPDMFLFLLIILFLILLIPYIRHYYILENGVQKLYTYFDMIHLHK